MTERTEHTFASLEVLLSKDRNAFKRVVDELVKAPEREDGPPASKRGRREDSGLGDSQSQMQSAAQVLPFSGTIESVTLENFLCHTHMKVVFPKDVTFIKGDNGAGKSSILTGIIVALGGNANTTGRGAALKDFVKHGAPSARVTCVVRNAGALSYKKEQFGGKIVIIRTLLSQGGSNVKMQTEKGKLVSSKMEDLRAMTLKLGIQVDNPISVLDQNTARHFLNQSKPSDKFDLFMRATNLEFLQKIFEEIALNIHKINQEINKKERQLIDNNYELEEAQKKWNLIQNLEKDREKGDSLKMELLWAEVRDNMIALGHAQSKLSKVQEELETLNNMPSSKDHIEHLLQEIESAQSQICDLQNQRKFIETDIKDLKTKHTSANQNHKRLTQDERSLMEKVEMDQKTIRDFISEIQTQEQKMMPEHITIRQKQKEEILQLEKMKMELKSKHSIKEAEINSLQTNASVLNDTVDELKRRKKRRDDNMGSLVQKLKSLESSDSNLTVFGPYMPELVRAIEMSHEFNRKPIGPIGALVKVKNPVWVLAVESVLKPRLNSFLVDNLDDEKLLLSMIKKIFIRGPMPGVVRTKYPTQRYDTTRTAARTSEYCNVLDMIEVDDVIAENILIDLCKIEIKMLIPTDDECFALLSDVAAVPRNCARAYTLNADSYLPAPFFGTYHSTIQRSTILQTSRADVIRDTKQRINETSQELQSIDANLHAASIELENVSSQIKNARIVMNNIARQTMEAHSKLEKLKDIEQPDTNSVAVLREELAAKEQELQENRLMLDEFPAKLEAIEKERLELRQAGNELQGKMKEITGRIEDLQSKQKTCREQMDELQSAKVDKKRKLEQALKKESQFTEESEELEEKFRKSRADAEKLEAHVQKEAGEKNKEFQSFAKTQRSCKVIDQELHVLHKKLASVEKIVGQSAEATEKEYEEKQAAYKAIKRYIKELRVNANVVKRALLDRKSIYSMQQTLVASMASHQFLRVLAKRNLAGRLKLDFKKGSLNIIVGPVDGGEKGGRGPDTLSGGERSYVTTALIISLFQATDLPFYYFDEFDVFMDEINRQTAEHCLMENALLKRGRQFIFLSPLNSPGLVESERVSVLRLEKPRS